ncbi:hypothetical protein PMNALOAF_2651 [Methylobacterium adhaesivum]|uniref:DUF680 domain-containing protein n=1 Tax=Methylobacterium adhaesivum TaxID=333297 RepID=A0ABT8BGI9_9HYPH|nr:hypothetical protein [Methylobacterium adhaesivum]MDN3590572.1 hypothetical protein [Methylobacterium adhaesivum]GJD31394.1 hypothetical protein PMNALOAF_2651 [Methylobacterium adhaesivum]
MKSLAYAAAALVFTVGGALAQSPSGNVGQPERAVPQAGNTTRGPIDNPSVYGAYRNAETDLVDLDVTGSVGPRQLPSNSEAVIVDSAKGGNAEQNNRTVPNLGATSGGPEF